MSLLRFLLLLGLLLLLLLTLLLQLNLLHQWIQKIPEVRLRLLLLLELKLNLLFRCCQSRFLLLVLLMLLLPQLIHRHCGTLPEHQTLILRSCGQNVALMDDESKMFGFYSPTSGMEIHVKDSNPSSAAAGGWLENVALVERYRMTDEDYDKRTNTVRTFKKEKMASDPTWVPPTMKSGKEMMQQMGTLPPDLPRGPETIEGIEAGMRCEVAPGARRGVVMFTGEVDGLKGGGNWVGVKLDEPLGKSDGTIKGIKVFECPATFGCFARGVNVKVGDFPEKDPFASDEEDSDEDEI